MGQLGRLLLLGLLVLAELRSRQRSLDVSPAAALNSPAQTEEAGQLLLLSKLGLGSELRQDRLLALELAQKPERSALIAHAASSSTAQRSLELLMEEELLLQREAAVAGQSPAEGVSGRLGAAALATAATRTTIAAIGGINEEGER